MSRWPIYRGTGDPHDGIADLPAPPNWRTFDGEPVVERNGVEDLDSDPSTARRLGTDNSRTPSPLELQMINAALYLRRPLLVPEFAHEVWWGRDRPGRWLSPVVPAFGVFDGLDGQCLELVDQFA